MLVSEGWPYMLDSGNGIRSRLRGISCNNIQRAAAVAFIHFQQLAQAFVLSMKSYIDSFCVRCSLTLAIVRHSTAHN